MDSKPYVVYYEGDLELKSPLAIGNGEDKISKNDLIRDGQGQVFIPGTSLAGAIKSVINHKYKMIETNFFGKENRKSNIYFYDCYLKGDKKAKIQIRDGNNIKEKKLYNYEILEIDNVFTFKIKIELNTYNDNYKKVINTIIHELSNDGINIGSNKSSGLGKIRVTNLKFKEFLLETKEDLDSYINFIANNEKYDNYTIDNDLLEKRKNSYENIIETKVMVRDTLFVRDRLLPNTNVDACQLSYGECEKERFIIPGTSIRGVFRKRINELIEEIKKDINIEYKTWIISQMFGSSDNCGLININEVRDTKKSRFTELRRTSIDRFRGSSARGKLFDGKIAYNTATDPYLDLSIKIRANSEKREDNKYSVSKETLVNGTTGLVLIALYDLLSGFITVGGEGAVGRGFLVHNKAFGIKKELITINDKKLNSDLEKKVLEDITKLLYERRG